jgi:hypothetical protein
VSSNTPNATMKPICVTTTSGSTASAPNVPREHDARAGDDGARHGEPAQRAFAWG